MYMYLLLIFKLQVAGEYCVKKIEQVSLLRTSAATLLWKSYGETITCLKHKHTEESIVMKCVGA